MTFIGRDRQEFAENARHFGAWLTLNALPLWSTLGRGDHGLFREALSPDVVPVDRPVRARTQTRQVYVYCRAGELGWRGPWRDIAGRGLTAFCAFNSLDNGFFRTLVDEDGSPRDDTVSMYDQAFALFALASAAKVKLDGAWQARARELREALLRVWPAGKGLTEVSDQPFQSNPHMHLLEASLAWEEASDDPAWIDFSDRLARLATTFLIDSEEGFLREFFDQDWAPAAGPDGQLVEPGHQFEWCWLLSRYASRRADANIRTVAARLYEVGKRGIDPVRHIALDSMTGAGGDLATRARLWPQTEWLKAALILAELADGPERATYLADADAALTALGRYLDAWGTWKDKSTPDGFVEEPAPATSLYHIMAAFEQLQATTARLNLVEIDLGRPSTGCLA